MSKELRARILSQALLRVKKKNSAFSVRALARKLAVSPAFVSNVLNGKTDLPFSRVPEFAKYLGMDELQRNRLLKTYVDPRTMELLGKTARPARDLERILDEYVELTSKQEDLLKYWYFSALLDLAECANFKLEPKWIAKKLRISAAEAERALEFVLREKLLIEDKGGWRKAYKHIRFPTLESRDVIRGFHAQMMRKAIATMETQTAKTDFERRLITGVTAAANPKHVRKAIEHIEAAVFEASRMLNEGDCTEVYQLGFQIFPVTSAD